MQEKQEIKKINKSHSDYLIDYINKNYDCVDHEEACYISYLGNYEADSKGDIRYFPEIFVRSKYRQYSTTPTRTVFKYETRLNISRDSEPYGCVIEFHIMKALQYSCREIINKISTKIIEYKIFIDEKDEKLSLHHVIRIGGQLVIILNEAYNIVNLYYINDFFNAYKDKTLQEKKIAVLFFTLCAYSDKMRYVTQEVDIHNLTVEDMNQYITLVDMIEV